MHNRTSDTKTDNRVTFAEKWKLTGKTSTIVSYDFCLHIRIRVRSDLEWISKGYMTRHCINVYLRIKERKKEIEETKWNNQQPAMSTSPVGLSDLKPSKPLTYKRARSQLREHIFKVQSSSWLTYREQNIDIKSMGVSVLHNLCSIFMFYNIICRFCSPVCQLCKQ